MRRSIRNQRQDRNQHPNPVTRAAIPEIPQEFRQTQCRERFLFFDSGVGDENRLILNSAEHAIEYSRESSHWFADGTFKVCSNLFFQVYSVHALDNGRSFPCIYGLLPNKTEETYNRLWQEVGNVVQHNPDDIMTNFEIASINAAAANFPGIEMKSCFYHLSSNFWKRIQQAGLQERYTNEEDFANVLCMIPAIAFVPPGNVVTYFEELADHLRNAFNADCDDLLDYFEDSYIGRFRRNAPWRAPLFSINLWNMFHRTFDELPRTTNCIEGWHRSLQATVAACQPTLHFQQVGDMPTPIKG